MYNVCKMCNEQPAIEPTSSEMKMDQHGELELVTTPALEGDKELCRYCKQDLYVFCTTGEVAWPGQARLGGGGFTRIKW